MNKCFIIKNPLGLFMLKTHMKSLARDATAWYAVPMNPLTDLTDTYVVILNTPGVNKCSGPFTMAEAFVFADGWNKFFADRGIPGEFVVLALNTDARQAPAIK